ncbi:MAG: transposase [Pseudomonadota bacterium]
MATPRSQLVDSEMPLFYHLISRCVRGSWLCGQDPRTGKNYDHRKAWVEQSLFRLARSFAIELYGYAIMSNHFHVIVRFDPGAAKRWTDEEVVDRWLNCCAATNGANPREAGFIRELRREQFLGQPEQIQRLRNTLGSLSMFKKHLKQPIARRANREDNCKGHFFESRFYSGALLDEAAAINALAYVDLNPVRAKIVRRAAEAVHTSLRHRLRAAAGSAERLTEYLAPLVSGLEDTEDKEPYRLPFTLAAYLEYVEQFSEDRETPVDQAAAWYQRVAIFRHRQRAYGSRAKLSQWAAHRGWSRTGMAHP